MSLFAILGRVTVSSAGFAETNYTIPEDLTPVSEWADGFTAEEAEKFYTSWSAGEFSDGSDINDFGYLNISEVLPTMVIDCGPGDEWLSEYTIDVKAKNWDRRSRKGLFRGPYRNRSSQNLVLTDH